MIQALLRVPLAAILVLGIAWTASLVLGGDSAELVERERARLHSAFGQRTPIPTIGTATARGRSLPILDRFPPGISDTLRSGVAVSEVRIAVIRRILPFAGALVFAGGLAGAVFRERIRHARGYASPAAAFLARGLVCGALLLASLFGLTWLTLPYWVLYVAVTGAAVGACLYVSNLPIRL